MADIGLYRNLVLRARQEEALIHRRYLVALREPEKVFEMLDTTFVGIYRLNKNAVKDLIREIEPYMPRIRGTGLSNMAKVLAALNFYASGSYQRFVGVGTNMHQTSVSNCVRAVTQALNADHFRRTIHFPQTRQERNLIKQGFHDKFGMPGVVGCIDGTHIGIVRPHINEERYLNRKGYHSINTQIICDSDLNILSIDASHGGSSHDSFIWNQHPIREHLIQLTEVAQEPTWLLGDSGYALRAYLLTPILHTEPNTPEHKYTKLHCTVRCTVERCIGVLKARWRCLLAHRILHYQPHTAGYIANACAVLHNICIKHNIAVPVLPLFDGENEAARQVIPIVDLAGGRNPQLNLGQATRRHLINMLF